MTSRLRWQLAILALCFGAVGIQGHRPTHDDDDEAPHSGVYARFDLGSPQSAPLPTDIFTVRDSRQLTGRRVAYPYPDCTVRPSDCDDLAVVNTLDGWGVQSRVSIPFSGDIDLASISSHAVFVISLGHSRIRRLSTGTTWRSRPTPQSPRTASVCRSADEPECNGQVHLAWRATANGRVLRLTRCHGDPPESGTVFRSACRLAPRGVEFHSVAGHFGITTIARPSRSITTVVR